MGYEEYYPIAEHYKVPIVITGFEPIDMLEGVLFTIRQLEQGQPRSKTRIHRAVRLKGNEQSRKLIDDVFEVCDRKWRGVGLIPKSGYKLRYEYREHDAERLFSVEGISAEESSDLHQWAGAARIEEAA